MLCVFTCLHLFTHEKGKAIVSLQVVKSGVQKPTLLPLLEATQQLQGESK